MLQRISKTWAFVVLCTAVAGLAGSAACASAGEIEVGFAVEDITPPTDFPMAGYYHERLAEGTIDPLKAKAIYFRDGELEVAYVVCDLIGISKDLNREIRKRVEDETGIPASHIILSATHTHTAPDYSLSLYSLLGNQGQEESRRQYSERLVEGPTKAVSRAKVNASIRQISAGQAKQEVQVSFNRRFVMRDGSVQTWKRLDDPEVVRPAGPIDPSLSYLVFQTPGSSAPECLLSNFALHLDTVGGSRWSADYPHHLESLLRSEVNSEIVSIFTTGCCGDINHVDPLSKERNRADFIGQALGKTLVADYPSAEKIEDAHLGFATEEVRLPLEDVTPAEIERSLQVLKSVQQGVKVDFLEHVNAYKKLMLAQFRNGDSATEVKEFLRWGLSHSVAGIGPELPVDVSVITFGDDAAVVFLPGEVFVELGLAIKQASPYPLTMVVELAGAKETIYVPHRAAYAGGSYEVTNSTLQPGGGEMLVESALRLLRKTAAKK